MTKKDYITIAACIKAERNDDNTYDERSSIIYSIMRRIAVECAAENPRFDHNKFEKACGF